MKKLNIILLVGILGVVLNVGCSRDGGYVKCEGMVWNTMYHITYKGPASLQDSILPVLNEVSQSLSVFDKNSLVSRLNSEDSVVADRNMIIVYDASRRINELSDGRFDPTVSPLIDAWGFGVGHSPTADTLAVDSVMKFIGLVKTHREGEVIYKEDRRTQFNFSAIAKGYGCDAVGEMFRRNGVDNYMVEIGGELALSGKSPSGSKWNIAVDAPVEGNAPGEETALVLSLTDVGVATSGNYRNYREENGMKTSHTISPKTGRPVVSEILSATVIAPSCMEADAIATACMAGTLEEAEALLKATHTEGLLILADTIRTTPAFQKYIAK